MRRPSLFLIALSPALLLLLAGAVLEARWGPSWTSTELMDDLRSSPARQSGDLELEMGDAELVKFAGDRPEPDGAEAHWQAVHDWIEGEGVGARPLVANAEG